MMPNSFLIEITSGSPETVHLKTNEICERFIKTTKTGKQFKLFMGEHTNTPFASGPMPAGTLIEFLPEENRLVIKCDRLGTAIIFWRNSEQGILISNRLENLVTDSSQPDWSSIQQYLHTGYTVSDRTFYKDTYQTLPNSTLEVDTSSSSVTTSMRESHGSEEHKTPSSLLTAIEQQLLARLSTTEQSTLMMSAGWDSRTLLLDPDAIRSCYTHGDLNSREINLARSLSGLLRKDHLFVDVTNSSFDVSVIDTMLTSLGFGIFPIWFSAARNVQNWTDKPIMSGVLGELLGGHYGLMAWGNRLQKALSSFLLVSDNVLKDSQVANAIDSYAEPPISHWFVSNEGQAILDEHRRETKTRLINSLELHKRESGSWQRAIEDFNMEHRARQYILKQAQAASTTIGYTIPFADEHLTDLVRQLEFSHRIHNKANRLILKNTLPELLDAPMAATLIPARYPIILQELSRGFRILREQFQTLVRRPSQPLGWFNYNHLYDSNTLHQIADSLTSSIWDKDCMHQTIRSNPQNGIDAGSTLDMLCKLKTVDHYLQHLVKPAE